jgi:DNA primase
MKNVTRNDVAKQVLIVDIAKTFSIPLEEVTSGNFDYRCRCPSTDHKSGKERTSSLYINSKDNDFFCYGCNKGTSSIDFYMLCSEKNFSDALKDLKELVAIPGKYQDVVEQKKIVFPFQVDTSEIIRNFLIKNPEKINKIDHILRKIDVLSEIHKDDPDKIKNMNEKLINFLEGK